MENRFGVKDFLLFLLIAALIGVVLLLMIVELLNTAIEKLSDHVTPHHHDAIGRIKDMASAAVGLSLLLCGLVWLIALAERVGLP